MTYRNVLFYVLMLCLLVPGVSAQEPEPAEAPIRLEEIVVIGSRIEGRSIKTPLCPWISSKPKTCATRGNSKWAGPSSA